MSKVDVTRPNNARASYLVNGRPQEFNTDDNMKHIHVTDEHFKTETRARARANRSARTYFTQTAIRQ